MGWTHQGHVLTSMARRIHGFRLNHKAIAQFQCRFQRLQLSVSPMSLKFLWQKLSTLLINRTCRHLEELHEVQPISASQQIRSRKTRGAESLILLCLPYDKDNIGRSGSEPSPPPQEEGIRL